MTVPQRLQSAMHTMSGGNVTSTGGGSAMPKTFRPDQSGTHRAQYDRNKKKIYATQRVCAICGQPVDFRLKWPDPLSPTIDHIIPVAKGGHPSDINNLQLAHFTCNRQKSDKLINQKYVKVGTADEVISNRVLPQSMVWTEYRSR